MSTPAHLWLEDENGSPIVGSCMMPLRLGSIELKSFSHGVTIPVEPSGGKLTGTMCAAGPEGDEPWRGNACPPERDRLDIKRESESVLQHGMHWGGEGAKRNKILM